MGEGRGSTAYHSDASASPTWIDWRMHSGSSTTTSGDVVDPEISCSCRISIKRRVGASHGAGYVRLLYSPGAALDQLCTGARQMSDQDEADPGPFAESL